MEAGKSQDEREMSHRIGLSKEVTKTSKTGSRTVVRQKVQSSSGRGEECLGQFLR